MYSFTDVCDCTEDKNVNINQLWQLLQPVLPSADSLQVKIKGESRR